MLLGIVTGPSLAEAQSALDQARGKIQGIEFRFDLFASLDLDEIGQLIDSLGLDRHLKILFALRPVRQGGYFKGTEEERLELLKQLCLLGPDYVDLEYDVPSLYFKEFKEQFPDTQLICSFHNWVDTPSDLHDVLERIKNPYADIYKMALMAHTANDGLAVGQLIQRCAGQIACVGTAMGERGSFLRILGPVIGNGWDYVCLSQATAPGQLTVEKMEHPYRYSQLNRKSAIYGLIGFPVEHSIGDQFHNRYFDDHQINAVYVKMPVSASELPVFVKLAKEMGVQGLSVTMPLKEAIIPFLDRLTPSACAIGAVNTIKVIDGQWIGYNTDGMGALDAIELHMPVKDKHLVIIGAGGSAKAIAYEALQRGAHLSVVNRTASRAIDLARHLQNRCVGGGFDLWDQILKVGYDIVVNTLPNADLIDPSWILPHVLAMDIVYAPQQKAFLEKASEKGCELIYGHEMFIHQAMQQQRIWFSHETFLWRWPNEERAIKIDPEKQKASVTTEAPTPTGHSQST